MDLRSAARRPAMPGLLSAAMLGACAPSLPAPPPGAAVVVVPAGTADACEAGRYGFMAGRPGRSVAGLALHHPHRVIAPDAAVTTEFRGDRINFYTDASGTITRVACG